jgi:hypothetical protein
MLRQAQHEVNHCFGTVSALILSLSKDEYAPRPPYAARPARTFSTAFLRKFSRLMTA